MYETRNMTRVAFDQILEVIATVIKNKIFAQFLTCVKLHGGHVGGIKVPMKRKFLLYYVKELFKL